MTPEKIAADFALVAPIGQPVHYYPILPGTEFRETRIRSEPWVTGSGHVLVALEGMSGGKSIDHIRFPVIEKAAV